MSEYKLSEAQKQLKKSIKIQTFLSFIQHLVKSSPPNHKICFQGFRDTYDLDKSTSNSTQYTFINKDRLNLENKTGREFIKTLALWNLEGFTVSVGINSFSPDSKGEIYRRKQYVSNINAFVVDIDEYLELSTLKELIEKVKPNIVNLSSKKDSIQIGQTQSSAKSAYKSHLYWLVGENWEGLKDRYNSINKALASRIDELLGKESTDKSIGIEKAIRASGFLHLKNYTSQIGQTASGDSGVFTVTHSFKEQEAINKNNIGRWLKDLGVERKHFQTISNEQVVSSNEDEGDEEDTKIQVGNRNNALYNRAWKMFKEQGLWKRAVLGEILLYNQEKLDKPLSVEEVKTVVESAYRAYKERLTPGAQKQLTMNSEQGAMVDGFIVDKVDKESEPETKLVSSYFEYDYSNREHFIDVLSDKSIAYRLHQRFGLFIKSAHSFADSGVRTYRKDLGVFDSDTGQIDTWINKIISDLPKEAVVRKKFEKVKNVEVEENGETTKKKKVVFDKDKLDSYITSIRSAGKSSSMCKMIHNMEIFQAHVDKFDSQLQLLNLPNGVLDLETGKVLAHSPKYLFTKCTKAIFRHEEDLYSKFRTLDTKQDWLQGGAWTKFILEIMDEDLEMARFLQISAGYSLEGALDAQVLFSLLGGGRNGKSVFLETLMYWLGSYARAVSTNMFTQVRGQSTNETAFLAELAQLVGVRMIVSMELQKGSRLKENTIKDVTTGAPILAKHYFKTPFTFKPQFTSFLHGNHKPKIKGSDEGIWRRYIQIPFYVDFKDRLDPNLAKKLRAEEVGREVLAWLVAGNRMYKNEGIVVPGKAEKDLQEFKDDMMPIDAFVRDCLFETALERQMLKRNELYSAYTAYCMDKDIEPLASAVFSKTLKRSKGIDCIKGSDGVKYYTVGLTPMGQQYGKISRLEQDKMLEEMLVN